MLIPLSRWHFSQFYFYLISKSRKFKFHLYCLSSERILLHKTSPLGYNPCYDKYFQRENVTISTKTTFYGILTANTFFLFISNLNVWFCYKTCSNVKKISKHASTIQDRDKVIPKSFILHVMVLYSVFKHNVLKWKKANCAII